MRWHDKRIAAYLAANTEAVKSAKRGRPGEVLRWRDLVLLHWQRGGWLDHLLCFWLVPFTFGLSLLLWQRICGSCCFAGYLDINTPRTGCLIYPSFKGARDLRRHAFPLLPTLRCNRSLVCPMLIGELLPADNDWLTASRFGAATLRRSWQRQQRRQAKG